MISKLEVRIKTIAWAWSFRTIARVKLTVLPATPLVSMKSECFAHLAVVEGYCKIWELSVVGNKLRHSSLYVFVSLDDWPCTTWVLLACPGIPHPKPCIFPSCANSSPCNFPIDVFSIEEPHQCFRDNLSRQWLQVGSQPPCKRAHLGGGS